MIELLLALLEIAVRGAHRARAAVAPVVAPPAVHVDHATTDDTSRIAFQRWASTPAREASADRSVPRDKLSIYHAAAGT